MTIKDIARLSGYGVGTVSRVLNNHPDVSEKARAKIMEVVEANDFQPNSNAKHLKMQASSSIHIIVKGTKNFLFADIVEQMQDLFLSNGEETSLHYLDEEANEVKYAIQLCKERNPKGIAFLGANLEYFRNDFKDINIPCVIVTNSASELPFRDLSSVTTCDEEASYAAIDYLASRGHRHIGVIGGTLSGSQISRRRLSGARKAFEKNHLPFDQELQYQTCRFSMEAGYEAAKKLIDRMPEVTAIFSTSDVVGMGVLRAIHDMGKKVPEDISVIGYDGVEISNYCNPRMTTIVQDTRKLAQTGVDLLLQRIDRPYDAVHYVTPFRLLERESVISIDSKEK